MDRSSKILKVVGILMIIFGGLGALLSLLGLLGAGAMSVMADELALYGVDQTTSELVELAFVGSVVLLIASGIQLAAGIVGVKNHNKPENANICFVFAIIVIIVQLLGTVLNVVSAGVTGGVIFGIIIGLVIPVLYLIGSLQLKKLADDSTAALT